MARVIEEPHILSPPTRLATCGVNRTCLYLQPQSINALRPVLIFLPAEDRRLSWPRQLIRYPRVCLPMSALNTLDVE